MRVSTKKSSVVSGLAGIAAAPVLAVAWPLLIFVGAGVSMYRAATDRSRKLSPGPVCRVDNDCPPGYVCIGGRCIPAGA